MKKLILSAVIIIAAISVNAQNKIGLQGGASFTTVKSEDGGVSNTSDTKVGFTFGAIADVDFGNSVSFRPELNFMQKGGQQKNTNTIAVTTFKTTNNLTLNYVQLAPNFVYNFGAGTGKFFVGVGPEFAFGLGGKDKYEQVTTGTINATSSDKTNVKFDGDKNTGTDPNYHLKSFDFGANALAGYTLSNGAFISAGYTVGLQNISPDDNSSFKNNGFNVKIGFLFGGNKSKK